MDTPDNTAEKHHAVERLGFLDALPSPSRSDADFVLAVRNEVAARRTKAIWGARTALWGPALATAAALAWWVMPVTTRAPPPSQMASAVASKSAGSHIDQLLRGSMVVLDEEDLWLDDLDDESLVALHDSLER